MRSLAVFLFFSIFFFGVGSILLSFEASPNTPMEGLNYSLGQFPSGKQQTQTTISTEVDREDDSGHDLACTSDPNDCNLRSAINIANSDGKPTTITFAANYLIRLSSPLPALSEDNTVVKAAPGQEVHLNGNGTAGSVLRITGARIEVNGLRIYGAGAGYPNLAISEGAYGTVIANNVIGDDDAPSGNCGAGETSYGGIFVDATSDYGDGYRAWIYGNIIECHRGNPGDGITVRSNKVLIGRELSGDGSNAYRNIIRLNNGFGVNLTDSTDISVYNNDLSENVMGPLFISNFHNNNFLSNSVADSTGNIK